MKPRTCTVRESFIETIECNPSTPVEVEIEFDRVTTYSHDAHYGADADGNRGRPMDFVDEDRAENVVVSWDDRTPITLDALADAWPKEGDRADPKRAVLAAVNAYLERVEPTPEEEEEGPDPDDEPEDYYDD